MVLGFVLIDFIKPQKSKPASPHPLDEFYCLRCRTHKKPFGMMADSLLSPVWRCQVMHLKATEKATKQDGRQIWLSRQSLVPSAVDALIVLVDHQSRLPNVQQPNAPFGRTVLASIQQIQG
jgi:hypothetical protein